MTSSEATGAEKEERRDLNGELFGLNSVAEAYAAYNGLVQAMRAMEEAIRPLLRNTEPVIVPDEGYVFGIKPQFYSGQTAAREVTRGRYNDGANRYSTGPALDDARSVEVLPTDEPFRASRIEIDGGRIVAIGADGLEWQVVRIYGDHVTQEPVETDGK